VAAAQHSLAGFRDWRLPNKNELASIVEYRCVAAINKQAFPNTPSAEYWSSSPSTYTYSSSYAWYVNFASGGVSFNHKGSSSLVRLVRAGQ